MATRHRTTASSVPGPSAGLTAEIIPLTLKVIATRPGGASVNMTRGVEVALIPVFQFGVFSDSDLELLCRSAICLSGPGAHQWQPFPGERTRDRSFLMTRSRRWEKSFATGWPTTTARPAPTTGRCVCAECEPGGCDPPNPTANANCLKFSDSSGQLEWRNSARRHADQSSTTWTNTSTQIAYHLRRIHRQRHLDGSAAADPSVRAGRQRLGAAD